MAKIVPSWKLRQLLCVSENYHRLHATLSQATVGELQAIVGNKNVITSESSLEQYAKDESAHTPHRPGIAVKPQSTDQVSAIAKLCHRQRIPIIPFGAGSGFEGGVIPVKGGVTVDLTLMNNVLEVHPDDFDVTVEPGVPRKALNIYLRDTGLWFPIDPGADATMAGMASTSASGTNAVRYGTMRENVLNLEVVLPDGSVINTAGKGTRTNTSAFLPNDYQMSQFVELHTSAVLWLLSLAAGCSIMDPMVEIQKTSAGYNLTNLFVGSEGTLGIFTKVSLRLYAIPEMITSAVCNFPTVKDAVTTAIQTLQANVPIARVELLDALAMKACNSYSKLAYKELPTLFLEFQGTNSSVTEQANLVGDIASSNGGEGFVWTKDADERNKLWAARHNLLYAILALRPGSKFVSSDVCVPISELSKVIEETQKDIASEGIIGPVLGHVGDGNFHAFMLLDPDNPEDKQKIHRIVDRLAKRAWASNGTCTGEHGIGLGKMHLLEEEIGASGLAVMKKIKQTVDPLNIMNPGKVLYI